RPGRQEAALVVVPRPFHRKEHGTAPLAAHANTLHESQNGQDHRSPQANHRVARQECDQERRDAHQHQGNNKGGLASHTITVMTEDEGADRTRDKADKINAKRVEGRGQWVFVRKEELTEDEAGHRAVQEKIVPLDRGSYSCGYNGATELSTMLVRCKRI